MKKLSNICMVIGLLFLTASCAGTMKTANADRLTEKNQVPFGNLEITPYIGNVVYAAQPDENTVKMFKDQNFDLVINIRELNEDIGFDEKKLVEDQGITYMQIPYMTEPNFNADFSNEALSKIKEAIDDATSNGKKVMLHCSHGQRAGSSHGMILYRDYGYTKEAALKASTAAGMNSEWAVPKFHKFIDNSLVKVTSFEGIDKSYAIAAGREVRVFVKPDQISDLEAKKMARDIALRIENELGYPGEIKINVIRESRCIEYAR